MLVHKRTMGAIEYVWDGEYKPTGINGRYEAKMRQVKLEDVDYPDEWWYVPSGSALARKVNMYYPWIEPVVDNDGCLVDVVLTATQERRANRKEQQIKNKSDAMQRGYAKYNKNLRPKNLMPFVQPGKGKKRKVSKGG